MVSTSYIQRERLKTEIRALRNLDKSWRQIGEIYGVNHTVLYRMFKEDYDPEDQEIRDKLGLDDDRPYELIIIRRQRRGDGTFR